MRRLIVLLAAGALLLSPVATQAGPLVVNPGLTATQLANALLSGSSGITINSATYTGAAVANGSFTGGTGIIGFESGIILSTGNAAGIVGPNNSASYSGINNQPGSAILNAIAGGITHDASILQIDFTPTGSQVEFKYVFGSEEYNEFVGSGFNDVFAFQVNGTNYALVPGDGPITVNNINCSAHSAYYVNNSSGSCPNHFLDTQLDGLTVVLSLVAPVNPGVSNTLWLGIADTGDSIYDSDVMIQAGSFQVCGDPGMPPCDVVPEPASLLLLGAGLAGIANRALRKRRG